MCKKKQIYDAKSDPVYQNPVVDERKMESRSVGDGVTVNYHYVHGHFAGTKVKFLFCIPLREAFEWRFYQHISPFPGPDEELASLSHTGENDKIGFALTHGTAMETRFIPRGIWLSVSALPQAAADLPRMAVFREK